MPKGLQAWQASKHRAILARIRAEGIPVICSAFIIVSEARRLHDESAARLATYIDELRSNASEQEDDAFDEDFGEDDIRHLALDE